VISLPSSVAGFSHCSARNASRPARSFFRTMLPPVTTLPRPPLPPIMAYFSSPEFFRVIFLGATVALHTRWRQLVTTIVPEPYLDEVFHVPQAQAYWQARWSQWDPKITTPPALYLFSYAVNTVRSWFSLDFEQTTEELRFVNTILLYLLLIALYLWTAVARREVHHEAVVQREFSIVVFPLFFFFSALYYTDVFSTFSVVLTYVFSSAAGQANGRAKVTFQILHLVSGLVALATRQTNIFWVAVYLGGLQVVESVKQQAGVNRIHDPPMSEAFFEGLSGTSILSRV
jgi:alpha-1,2-glucosyltransferase